MGFFDDVQDIIRRPGEFFQRVKDEPGMLKPWLFFARISLVSTFVAIAAEAMRIYIMTAAGAEPVFDGGGIGFLVAVWGLAFLFLYLLSLGFIFVTAGIMHLFMLIVGGKNGYENTFKFVSYSTLPSLLLAPFVFISAIPVVGGLLLLPFSIISVLYTWFLEVMGAKELHELTWGRAVIGAVVIPVSVAIILVVLFMAVIVGLFVVLAGSGGITGMVVNAVQ